MSKQQTLALIEALNNAPAYNSTATVRSGRVLMKINTKNIAAYARALKNCHRKQVAKGEKARSYPAFKTGMSTADYVRAFGAMNGKAVNLLPFDPLNPVPCTLYENGALDFDVVEEIEEVAASADSINEFMKECVATEQAAPVVATEDPAPTESAPVAEAAPNFAKDIPVSLSRAAFCGTSFSPDKRGDRMREEYAADIAEALEKMTAHAKKGGTLDALPAIFARYRAQQAQALRAYLASSSRCVSTMIAGASNFPAARMNKRADIAHKRLGDYLDGGAAAMRRAIRDLRPDLRPIMSGDADAIERLTVKIEQAERSQEMMKAANAAIRKHAKAGAAHQVAALMELGFKESSAISAITPDYAGRVGFPSYALTNNNANIRRMRERLEQITRAQAKPVTQVQSASGITLEDDAPANRVRIFFPGKPAEEVRIELKKNGFRWAPSIGAWQAYRNRWTLETARELAGDPAQETPAAEIVEQSPPVAALEEVSPPCGDIAPAAQDVEESKAAAPVELEAADGAAAPEATIPCEGIAPASPEYVALRSAARAARRVAVAAIHKARHTSRTASAKELAGIMANISLIAQERTMEARKAKEREDAKAAQEAVESDDVARMLAEFPGLVPTDNRHAGGVHAAKNIRLVLKKKFPGVKFSVKSDYSSVNVSWTDGPTDAAVSEAVAPFDIGYSDSMTDYFTTIDTRFSATYGGAQYLRTHRTLGPEIVTASIAAIYGENGPTYEEWKAGRGWHQVDGRGNYGPNAYSYEWDWLNAVRRHANGMEA